MGTGYRNTAFMKQLIKASMTALMMTTVIGVSLFTTNGQSLAQASAQVKFAVPAGPLNQALATFGRQAGLQVSYLASIAAGKTTKGFSGSASAQQAIAQILSGSGLRYSFTNSTTVAIAASPSSADGAAVEGATQLAPITVQGEQSATGPGDGFVAENTLAGSKTSTPLIETPQTVSVTTRAQIDAQQATNLTQAARYMPGIYFGDNTDTRDEYFKARGFTLDQYQDGLKLQTQGAWIENKIDPFFLDRIDVLEGPSSGLYGQVSPGGLVNLVSKRPTDTPFGHIQLQTGSFDRAQAAFDFGGPVTEDGALLYRLTGLGRTTGAQVDDMKEQRLAIAPALTIKPDEDTSLTILGSYLNDPKGGFWSSLPYSGTLNYNSALPGGKLARDFNTGQPSFEEFKRERESIGYEFAHRFDDVFTFRQNFRFSHVNSVYNALQAYDFVKGTSILQRDTYMYRGQANSVGLDNQLEADFDTGPLQHKALFGLDYQYLNRNDFSRYGVGPNINVLNPNYDLTVGVPKVNLNRQQSFNQLGVYAQDQIKFDRFLLTLTGRQDHAWSDTLNKLTSAQTDQSDNAFTGRVGLTYLFDNGLAPYVSYSTSFTPSTGLSFDGSYLDPTTGQQFEGGIKFKPEGWNALFTVAAFDLTQQNVPTTDPLHSGFQVQTGEIRSRGVELSAVASLTDAWSMQASYAYLDPKVTKDNSGLVGNEPANVPRNVAKLWMDYTVQSGPLAGLGIGGGARYIGESFANTTNTAKIPDYVLFDAAVRYDFGNLDQKYKGLTASVNASNLFDKVYVSDCSNINCRWGQGRTVYATLDYRW
ncbi:iron complex outermembrane receptor protein [Rhizobium sp. WW_1]|jgi:iron complex outermembrane receptor protein|nr:iron complex outermembrane receptor protein [Rhizobium sp. WW_1]